MSEISLTSSNLSKRIEYIDALRGFTMILVVLFHVSLYCFDPQGTSSFHHYLRPIRMPMFFFISGFVMFKAETIWNLSYVYSFLKKKFPVQILSTSIFLLAYLYVYPEFLYKLKIGTLACYWFTFVLFIFYIFYSLLRVLFRKKEDYIIVIVGVIFFLVFQFSKIINIFPFLSQDLYGILCMEKWCYFLFFILGTLAKKHFLVLQKVLDHKATIMTCLAIYLGLNIIGKQSPYDEGFPHAIIGNMVILPGMVILFSFFRNNQDIFNKKYVIGRSLQYIGRRTLDIYLIHFFLIPYQLHDIVTVFHDYSLPVVEFTVTLFISLIVIVFSLLISNILRLSPIIAHYLFGAKNTHI